MINDSKVIKGKLDNKLTYYICNDINIKEKEIYLLLKIGSKSETIDKIGVSHFLEHMCLGFNKAGRLIENKVYGYTNFEETIYCIYVDQNPKSFFDSIDILHDILTAKVINPNQTEEIKLDIIEEWHWQMESDYYKKRNMLYKEMLPKNLSERMPIGKLQNIKDMSIDTILQFHCDYYVTENAALIFNGEFNGINLSDVIKSRFGELKYNASKLEYIPTLDDSSSKQKRYVIDVISQPEHKIICEVYLLNKVRPMTHKEYLKNFLFESLLFEVFKSNLASVLIKNNICFLIGDFNKNKVTIEYEIYSFEIILYEIKLNDDDIKRFLSEFIEKFHNQDITQNSFNDAKNQITKEVNELTYKSHTLVQECKNNFIYNEPILSYHEEQMILNEIAARLTLDDLHNKLRL